MELIQPWMGEEWGGYIIFPRLLLPGRSRRSLGRSKPWHGLQWLSHSIHSCSLSYSRNVCINPEPGVWPAPGPGGAEEATLGCREDRVRQGDV